MEIRSFFRKASMTLGSILLAFNIGCNSYRQNIEPINLEQRIAEESIEHRPSGLKAWQYPVNFIRGYILTAVEHESSHALAAALLGAKINRIECPYHDEEGNTYVCAVVYDEETFPETGSTAETMLFLAGPLGSRLFIEAISYNLRNGNISGSHQPFWATTSLIARYLLIDNAMGVLEGKTQNDFNIVSENTGVSPETIMGIVLLDVALNYKRIAKEFRVAIGRDKYQITDKQKARIDVLPSPNGINLTYTLNF